MPFPLKWTPIFRLLQGMIPRNLAAKFYNGRSSVQKFNKQANGKRKTLWLMKKKTKFPSEMKFGLPLAKHIAPQTHSLPLEKLAILFAAHHNIHFLFCNTQRCSRLWAGKWVGLFFVAQRVYFLSCGFWFLGLHGAFFWVGNRREWIAWKIAQFQSETQPHSITKLPIATNYIVSLFYAFTT